MACRVKNKLKFRSSNQFWIMFSCLLGLILSSTPSWSDIVNRIERPSKMTQRIHQTLTLDIIKSKDRAIVVGEAGRVYISDDAGHSWTQVPTPTSVLLTSVSAVGDTIWAAGHDGVVLKSTDHGLNWVRVLDGRSINDALKTYYQKILAQAAQDPSLSPEQLEMLQFRADDAFIAIEEGALPTLLDVNFIDEDTGFIIGAYGLLLESRDGGISWIPSNEKLNNENSYHLNSISSHNQTLFIAGESGTLFTSNNLGKTWSSITTPYDGTLFGVHISSDKNWLVYGLRGNLFQTTSEGLEWEKIANSYQRNISDSLVLDDGSVVLTGNFPFLLFRSANTNSFVKIPFVFPAYGLALINMGNNMIIATTKGPQILSMDFESLTPDMPQ